MSKTAVDMVFANSKLARTYIEFRPMPPQSLISRVLEFTREKRPSALELCVDVGCGSGQTTLQYGDHFDKVLGIDVSQDQLELARSRNSFQNVFYKEGTAESIPAEDSSVDLVTSCAAVHWFNFKNFYNEVDRILKPGGVLACYSYHGCSPLCSGKNLRAEFLEIWESLSPYWPVGHDHLRSEYRSLPDFYTEDVHLSGFCVEHEATLDTFLGYISSWSAFSKLRADKGEDAAEEFIRKSREKLLSAMETEGESGSMTRRYDYFLRLWRKPV